MTQPDDYRITEAMIRFGGSFVHHLGKLWRAGDAVNQAKLRAAFPEYWEEYSDIVFQQAFQRVVES